MLQRLITYRRRQRSNVAKQLETNFGNLHVIVLGKKGPHGVIICGKQRSVLLLPKCADIQK